LTRQTGNLSVILVGGTLFVVLAFALTTELFAKNSPSVLYSRAVDIIRDSDAVRVTHLRVASQLTPS
jgi:import inner membrane translocase subunit TIM21